MNVILTFSDYYLPGYKAGGSIRTLANMVDQLGDEFRFKVMTRDRDLGDAVPYPSIKADSWQRVSGVDVCYLSPQSLSMEGIRYWMRETEYDVLYLNSFFSSVFTIRPLLLRRMGLIPKLPLILAPRGELSMGAMGLKSFKKRIYLSLAKAIGLYKGILWQGSSGYEEEDIRRWFGNDVPVMVAPDLPLRVDLTKEFHQCEKTVGSLKVLFLSRISPMKNLQGALALLKQLNGQVQFNIYGPLEDQDYWRECQKTINLLPGNIKVRYRGAVEHTQVAAIMAEHDLFFLPSMGENFGHVILEALVAGCPALISDQTSWRNLAVKGAGWDLPLNRPEVFQAVLQQCIDMDRPTHLAWSQRAREYGLQCTQNNKVIEQNRALFSKNL